MDPTDAYRMPCSGCGPGHGRTGGLLTLPMGDFDAGGFESVRVGGAGGSGAGSVGRLDVDIGGRGYHAWHCDPSYLMIYLMLERSEPCYFHAETSLLACGVPEVRRFLSIGFGELTPCEQYRLHTGPEIVG